MAKGLSGVVLFATRRLLRCPADQGGIPPTREAPRSPIIDQGLPLPGDGFIATAEEMEFLKPVYVGDRLCSRWRLAELQQKATRLDPETVWITREQIITNQREETVAILRLYSLNYRSKPTE